VITALNLDNPINDIDSGTFAWSARRRFAEVDPKTALSAQGDAQFYGNLGSVPSPCANPLSLVRIASPVGAAGRWIATGAGRTRGN
jgi:hypothetical protein